MMSGISTMDVNQVGKLLVGDGLGSSVHLFSSSGDHIRAYSIPKCLPDDSPKFYPSGVRFLGQDKVIVMTLSGAIAVLSIDGRCIKASRRLSRLSMGFCTSNDSIFFLGIPLPVGIDSTLPPIITVYSSELHQLDEIPVKIPEYPVLNAGRGGIMGRNIDCFGNGPLFTYLGSTDAIPVDSRQDILPQRPEFYEKRPRDLLPTMSKEEKRKEWNRYITTDGIFALDDDTRMLVYRTINDRWLPKGAEDLYVYMGLSIASNIGQFASVSTISSFVPLATGYGYLYGQADPELLSDTDLGNPLILRYRFKRPVLRN